MIDRGVETQTYVALLKLRLFVLPAFTFRLVVRTASRHPTTSLTARPVWLLRGLMAVYNNPRHGKQYKDAERSLPPIPA